VKLTPLEVRKQTFRKTMRGFDPEEIRIFLDMVADEYERALQENGMLSEKVRYLNERLAEYHNLEKTLQSSIMTAERMAAESRERSRAEAEGIVNDAHIRSERILEDSRSRLRLLGEQIHHLSRQKDLFVQRFQDLLDAQGQFLGSHREELKAIDELDARAESLVAEMTPVEEDIPEAASDQVRESRPKAAEALAPLAAEEEALLAAEQEEFLPAEQEEFLQAAEEQRRRGEAPAAADPGAGPGRDPQRARTDRPLAQGPASYRPPRRRPIDNQADQDDDSGFFAPQERAEGFFEINAEEEARK
jgi:cell division initiation protein